MNKKLQIEIVKNKFVVKVVLSIGNNVHMDRVVRNERLSSAAGKFMAV